MSTQVADALAAAVPDYTVPNLPSSGAAEIDKPKLRSVGKVIDDKIDGLLDGTDPSSIQGQIDTHTDEISTIQTTLVAGGSSKIYGSTAAAQADSGLANNSYYYVTPSAYPDGAVDIYKKINSGSSTFQKTLPDASAIATETTRAEGIEKTVSNNGRVSYEVKRKAFAISRASRNLIHGFDIERHTMIGPGWDDGNGYEQRVLLTGTAIVPTCTMHAIPTFGESTGMGYNGGDAVNTATPYANKTFTGGPRYTSHAAIVPLGEVTNGTIGETPCSGYAKAFTEECYRDGVATIPKIFAWTDAIAGSKISEWQKGQTNYNRLITSINSFKTLAIAAGETYCLPAAFMCLGLNDATTASYTDIYNGLKQIQSDLQTDVQGITGQSCPVVILVQQEMGSTVTYDGALCRAQIDLCRDYPNLFKFVRSVYDRSFDGAGIHMTSADYYHAARPAGRLLKELIIDKIDPRSPLPISAIAWPNPAGVGDTRYKVRVRVRPRRRPWVINIKDFERMDDHGFVIKDDDARRKIKGIRVINGDTFEMDVDNLTTNPVFRAALDYDPLITGNLNGYCPIHDSEQLSYFLAGTEYLERNILPAFQLPITKFL